MVDHPSLLADDLERLLNLPADERWDVGQRYRPSRNAGEQIYQFSRWAIREKAASLDELPKAISNLMRRIRSVEQKFDLLPTDARTNLTLFVTETDTVIGLGVDNEVIKLLARINAGFEMSLLVAQP